MKRLLTHILAAALVLSLLLTSASCSRDQSAPETPTAADTGSPVTDAPTAPSEQDPEKAPEFTVLDSTGREVKL